MVLFRVDISPDAFLSSKSCDHDPLHQPYYLLLFVVQYSMFLEKTPIRKRRFQESAYLLFGRWVTHGHISERRLE